MQLEPRSTFDGTCEGHFRFRPLNVTRQKLWPMSTKIVYRRFHRNSNSNMVHKRSKTSLEHWLALSYKSPIKPTVTTRPARTAVRVQTSINTRNYFLQSHLYFPIGSRRQLGAYAMKREPSDEMSWKPFCSGWINILTVTWSRTAGMFTCT